MSHDSVFERGVVKYRMICRDVSAQERAEAICVEQTIEYPADLVTNRNILENIVGRVENIEHIDGFIYDATISYSPEVVGEELTQLLNVVFGNSSLLPGLRVESIELPATSLKWLQGPRFGRDGVRRLLGVDERPLLATAIKPMGLSTKELAAMAYSLALGGIDIIKDDHGLADQAMSPFHDRVARVADAVARANGVTGKNCLYAPNITADCRAVVERAHFAKALGAGALLVSPGLTGFAAMANLASDAGPGLPVLGHPALLGGWVAGAEHGIAHGALFGTLMRIAGADVSVFPSFGGRFALSAEDCGEIAHRCAAPLGHLAPAFPAPAGGMSLSSVPAMLSAYGRDTVLLIGGDLHRGSGDLTGNALRFLEAVMNCD